MVFFGGANTFPAPAALSRRADSCSSVLSRHVEPQPAGRKLSSWIGLKLASLRKFFLSAVSTRSVDADARAPLCDEESVDPSMMPSGDFCAVSCARQAVGLCTSLRNLPRGWGRAAFVPERVLWLRYLALSQSEDHDALPIRGRCDIPPLQSLDAPIKRDRAQLVAHPLIALRGLSCVREYTAPALERVLWLRYLASSNATEHDAVSSVTLVTHDSGPLHCNII